jgi:hypothetical protein
MSSYRGVLPKPAKQSMVWFMPPKSMHAPGSHSCSQCSSLGSDSLIKVKPSALPATVIMAQQAKKALHPQKAHINLESWCLAPK